MRLNLADLAEFGTPDCRPTRTTCNGTNKRCCEHNKRDKHTDLRRAALLPGDVARQPGGRAPQEGNAAAALVRRQRAAAALLPQLLVGKAGAKALLQLLLDELRGEEVLAVEQRRVIVAVDALQLNRRDPRLLLDYEVSLRQSGTNGRINSDLSGSI